MTTVDEETVQANDPRWDIRYHALNHWTTMGYLHPDKTHPGSGVNRRWPVGEVEVAARMVRLIAAGFLPAKAAVIARASGPVQDGARRPGWLLDDLVHRYRSTALQVELAAKEATT